MQGVKLALGVLLIFIFQEILIPVESARVRVIKVKKTRHDKRQTQQGGGYSDVDRIHDTPGSPLRPEDNPYNVGNRNVEYPHHNQNTPQNVNYDQNQYSSNQEKRPGSGGGGFTSTSRGRPRPAQRLPASGAKPGSHDGDHCEGCGNGIPGVAGTDYPTFDSVPKTNFDCKQQQWPGYYADVEARCQVFWICQKNKGDAFLCPNGTLFNQQVFVCDWWFNVDCGASTEYYSRNQYIYAGPGIDLFGNQVSVNNRQSTPVNPKRPATDIQSANRARPPTNRPPFQPPRIEPAITTVAPFTNQRQTYQTSIPIVQTTIGTFATTNQGGSFQDLKAVEQSNRNQGYFSRTPNSSTGSRNGATSIYTESRNTQNSNTGGYRTVVASRVPPGYSSRPSNDGYKDDRNNGGYSYKQPENKANFATRRSVVRELSRNSKVYRTEGNNAKRDNGNSYNDYIEAQKRLHLGNNYKPKSSYSQNPLVSKSQTPVKTVNSQSRHQGSGYRLPSNQEYSIKNSRYYHSPQKSGYQDNSRFYNGGSSTTTKRNAIIPDDLDLSGSSFKAPDEIFDDEGFKFSFAKTLVPTTQWTTPMSTAIDRSTKKVRKPSRNTPITYAFDDHDIVTTHRPSSRNAIRKHSKKVSTLSSFDIDNEKSTTVKQPRTYYQVPLRETTEATTPTPAFGKKIRSGKKRNTSDWTRYFHKN